MSKNDPVYYKVQLEKLFKQAQDNGLEIELGMKEVSFINNIYERASAKPNQRINPEEDEDYIPQRTAWYF